VVLAHQVGTELPISYQRIGCYPPCHFPAVLNEVSAACQALAKLAAFTVGELADLAWACATLALDPGVMLLQAIGAAAAERAAQQAAPTDLVRCGSTDPRSALRCGRMKGGAAHGALAAGGRALR
jgi:hypothetical protein